MTEYIERGKAKEEILSWAVVINRPQNLSTEDTLCVLDSIPTADVAPVQHGRWVEYEHEAYNGFAPERNCMNEVYKERNDERFLPLSR